MSDEFVLVGAGVNPAKQKVRSPEGQAEVFATTVNEFENVSARERLSFSWTIVPANFSAAETLLLVQNDSDTLILHIEEIELENDLSTLVQVHLTDRADLTPAGGTVVTGVCWNQTAPRKAPALARSNETSNAQGNIIWNHEVIADTSKVIPLHGAVLLGKGQSIGVDVTSGATAIASCTIRGFFAIPDEARV